MAPHERVFRFRLNGKEVEGSAEPRRLFVDYLRDDLGLTGTHVGCEHGVCGACTIQMNGRSVRSCLIFACQVDGAEIETVEGLAAPDEDLSPLQNAFWERHGLQCGFCTPGMLMTAKELLAARPDPTDAEIRDAISGNLCRCTGYVFIVDAIRAAAAAIREGGDAP